MSSEYDKSTLDKILNENDYSNLNEYESIPLKTNQIKNFPAVKENVDHPDHYSPGVYEVINVIEAWNLDFHLGNAVKYIARAGKKDPKKTIEDLQKAIWYLKREINKN